MTNSKGDPIAQLKAKIATLQKANDVLEHRVKDLELELAATVDEFLRTLHDKEKADHTSMERAKIIQELQELDRLKTEFLSTAAHEFRTPLTTIMGFSELLLSREMDLDHRTRYLHMINSQSHQLHKIVNRLLDLSQLESQRQLALDLEQITLQVMLDRILPRFVELSPNHTFQIEGINTCPAVLGDSFRLEQVFQNLLSNAVKYSPAGGIVKVYGRFVDGDVEIAVQDYGIGMTAQQQVHLFEQFYRADASNTTISGTGLGLAICKLIVELHGGKIWADSEYGAGCTIHFTLPVSVDTLNS